jgi:RNase H-fold protein (predicted Holliday junction resolvase)
LLALDPTLKIELVDERMTTMIATKRLLEADSLAERSVTP